MEMVKPAMNTDRTHQLAEEMTVFLTSFLPHTLCITITDNGSLKKKSLQTKRVNRSKLGKLCAF